MFENLGIPREVVPFLEIRKMLFHSLLEVAIDNVPLGVPETQNVWA